MQSQGAMPVHLAGNKAYDERIPQSDYVIAHLSLSEAQCKGQRGKTRDQESRDSTVNLEINRPRGSR